MSRTFSALPSLPGRRLWRGAGVGGRVRRGVTLTEAALATVIIGTGVLATLQLFAACTQENATAAQATTAMLLASHVQETMAGLPIVDPAYANTYFGPEPGQALATYDDVDDFDGS